MVDLKPDLPRLPFVPSPYPDEIFGSWINRIRVANGNGAWRAVLEHVGIGRRLQSVYFDMADHSEQLSMLLAYFGTTYERAMVELSTLPYWTLFTAVSDGSKLAGTTSIPALAKKTGSNKHIAAIGRIGFSRTKRELRWPRYCPKCLTQDLEEVGEPYWHRAHQLPNVYFCHRHHCALRSQCQKCGLPPGAPIKMALPLIAPVCSCGAQLYQIMDSHWPSSAEIRLATLSFDALTVQKPSWGREHVFIYLKSQLEKGAASSRGRFEKILDEVFLTEHHLLERNGLNDAKQEKPKFRQNIHVAGAADYCALLAALDIDIATAVKGIRSIQMKNTSDLRAEKPRGGVMSIAQAREAMLNHIVSHPTQPISRLRLQYWYLRLNDSEWLRARRVNGQDFRDKVPSIAADREKIMEIFRSPPSRPGSVRMIARTSPSGIRAVFRDEKWFRRQCEIFRQESAMNRAHARDGFSQHGASELLSALRETLLSEDRPNRIFASTLAAKAGLRPSQAAVIIRTTPALRTAIIAANDDKLRRQVLWAAVHLHASGVRLSKKQLGKKAGVPTAHVSDAVMLEIRAKYFRL